MACANTKTIRLNISNVISDSKLPTIRLNEDGENQLVLRYTPLNKLIFKSNTVSGGGGLVDDVLVNGTSVVVDKVANVAVPTKTSELENDSGFLTEHQSLANYYTKSETNTEISNHHDNTKYDASNPSGYTSNTGTVTSVAVKMNGSTKGTVTTSGTIDLGTVITSHQDISGKENTSNKVTSISSASTNTQYPSAKCVYDIVGNIEAALDAIRGV